MTTTDLRDPVHAAEVAAATQEPDTKALETSPLYGIPLGHWDTARRLEEV